MRSESKTTVGTLSFEPPIYYSGLSALSSIITQQTNPKRKLLPATCAANLDRLRHFAVFDMPPYRADPKVQHSSDIFNVEKSGLLHHPVSPMVSDDVSIVRRI